MSGPILMRAKTPLSWNGNARKKCQSCNSRCYNAKNDKEYCTCPCGGVNHGVGLANAVENTKALQAAGADVIFNEKEIEKAENIIKELSFVPVTKEPETQTSIAETTTPEPETASDPADPPLSLRDAKGRFVKRIGDKIFVR